MSVKYDILLMVKVAQMYYLNDMDCGVISEALEIPENVVSGILAEVVRSGIVDIKIRQCIPA